MRVAKSEELKAKNLGYTLIELMIVVTVMAVVAVVAVNLFLSTLIGGGKSRALSVVKQNGDFALTQMEKMIRNAKELTTNNEGFVCDTDMNSLGVINSDGGVTIFAVEGERIASNSGLFLTSSEVKVDSDAAKTLSFDCSRSDTGMPDFVEISFTLKKGEVGVSRQEEIAEEDFQTKVSLRKY